MASSKSLACIGDAKTKLAVIQNREATTADTRKMIELSSTEEGKKVTNFLKQTKKNKLIISGANGPLVFEKVKSVYDADPTTTLMKITDEKAKFPYNSYLVAVDKETGISIPCVQMLIGADTCPLFTYGANFEELQSRAIQNSAVIEAQMLDTKNYAANQKKRELAKLTNTALEKSEDYWDTYIAPLEHQTAENKAILFGRYGLLLANMMQIMTGGLFTLFNTVYPHLYEIDYQTGSAMGSLRAMKHEKITLKGGVEICMNKKWVNLPMVPALWLFRLYVNKNKAYKYLPNPIIYVPGVQHIMMERTEAFDINHVFTKINEVIKLADFKILDTIGGRDFKWHICSGRNPQPENVSEETVVFMVLEFKCIEQAFESIFNASGTSMVQSILAECRQLYMSTITLVLQNSGAISTTPFLLDGTNPASFISILQNAKTNHLLEEKDETKVLSMEEKQQQIMSSWEELVPAKRIISRTLPIGIYHDLESGENVDRRQEEKFNGGRKAAIFDFTNINVIEDDSES
jgi:hypothetical protein